MAEPKTKKNDASVEDFLNAIDHSGKREDSFEILRLMEEITGVAPKMWGGSIVGFDEYHYKYASGREGDWPIVGFSPRKQNISLYIMPGFSRFQDLLPKLGKHKTSKACLYINKLADVNNEVLSQIILKSVAYMREKYH
ncbi:DUF1801 domain-containing protein [Dokdonia sinensis]|uniref:DUF1801 domain-containing protein n=1 Tax=Dokdonia sinensis TaxID=2479847 RepID=A0A3M0G6A5_9FLAO|nr:DUF1801 domain-containing protein [Dokdonia sinensis]RMB60590.1 DUF1801 domain-containing protein [Dokdonia sinensis]